MEVNDIILLSQIDSMLQESFMLRTSTHEEWRPQTVLKLSNFYLIRPGFCVTLTAIRTTNSSVFCLYQVTSQEIALQIFWVFR